MEARGMRYFRAMYQVSSAINSTLDPLEVLRIIPQSAAEVLDAKGCSIMLLSPDKMELRHSAFFGLSEEYMSKGPVVVDDALAEALRGRSVAVADVNSDPRVQYPRQAAREGISSMLSVPMSLHDDVIGVLRIYTADRREFSEDEIEFVEAVADLSAIALENAKNHEKMSSDFDSLARYVYGGSGIAR